MGTWGSVGEARGAASGHALPGAAVYGGQPGSACSAFLRYVLAQLVQHALQTGGNVQHAVIYQQLRSMISEDSGLLPILEQFAQLLGTTYAADAARGAFTRALLQRLPDEVLLFLQQHRNGQQITLDQLHHRVLCSLGLDPTPVPRQYHVGKSGQMPTEVPSGTGSSSSSGGTGGVTIKTAGSTSATGASSSSAVSAGAAQVQPTPQQQQLQQTVDSQLQELQRLRQDADIRCDSAASQVAAAAEHLRAVHERNARLESWRGSLHDEMYHAWCPLLALVCELQQAGSSEGSEAEAPAAPAAAGSTAEIQPEEIATRPTPAVLMPQQVHQLLRDVPDSDTTLRQLTEAAASATRRNPPEATSLPISKSRWREVREQLRVAAAPLQARCNDLSNVEGQLPAALARAYKAHEQCQRHYDLLVEAARRLQTRWVELAQLQQSQQEADAALRQAAAPASAVVRVPASARAQLTVEGYQHPSHPGLLVTPGALVVLLYLQLIELRCRACPGGNSLLVNPPRQQAGHSVTRYGQLFREAAEERGQEDSATVHINLYLQGLADPELVHAYHARVEQQGMPPTSLQQALDLVDSIVRARLRRLADTAMVGSGADKLLHAQKLQLWEPDAQPGAVSSSSASSGRPAAAAPHSLITAEWLVQMYPGSRSKEQQLLHGPCPVHALSGGKPHTTQECVFLQRLVGQPIAAARVALQEYMLRRATRGVAQLGGPSAGAAVAPIILPAGCDDALDWQDQVAALAAAGWPATPVSAAAGLSGVAGLPVTGWQPTAAAADGMALAAVWADPEYPSQEDLLFCYGMVGAATEGGNGLSPAQARSPGSKGNRQYQRSPEVQRLYSQALQHAPVPAGPMPEVVHQGPCPHCQRPQGHGGSVCFPHDPDCAPEWWKGPLVSDGPAAQRVFAQRVNICRPHSRAAQAERLGLIKASNRRGVVVGAAAAAEQLAYRPLGVDAGCSAATLMLPEAPQSSAPPGGAASLSSCTVGAQSSDARCSSAGGGVPSSSSDCAAAGWSTPLPAASRAATQPRGFPLLDIATHMRTTQPEPGPSPITLDPQLEVQLEEAARAGEPNRQLHAMCQAITLILASVRQLQQAQQLQRDDHDTLQRMVSQRWGLQLLPQQPMAPSTPQLPAAVQPACLAPIPEGEEELELQEALPCAGVPVTGAAAHGEVLCSAREPAGGHITSHSSSSSCSSTTGVAQDSLPLAASHPRPATAAAAAPSAAAGTGSGVHDPQQCDAMLRQLLGTDATTYVMDRPRHSDPERGVLLLQPDGTPCHMPEDTQVSFDQGCTLDIVTRDLADALQLPWVKGGTPVSVGLADASHSQALGVTLPFPVVLRAGTSHELHTHAQALVLDSPAHSSRPPHLLLSKRWMAQHGIKVDPRAQRLHYQADNGKHTHLAVVGCLERGQPHAAPRASMADAAAPGLTASQPVAQVPAPSQHQDFWSYWDALQAYTRAAAALPVRREHRGCMPVPFGLARARAAWHTQQRFALRAPQRTGAPVTATDSVLSPPRTRDTADASGAPLGSAASAPAASGAAPPAPAVSADQRAAWQPQRLLTRRTGASVAAPFAAAASMAPASAPVTGVTAAPPSSASAPRARDPPLVPRSPAPTGAAGPPTARDGWGNQNAGAAPAACSEQPQLLPNTTAAGPAADPQTRPFYPGEFNPLTDLEPTTAQPVIEPAALTDEQHGWHYGAQLAASPQQLAQFKAMLQRNLDAFAFDLSQLEGYRSTEGEFAGVQIPLQPGVTRVYEDERRYGDRHMAVQDPKCAELQQLGWIQEIPTTNFFRLQQHVSWEKGRRRAVDRGALLSGLQRHQRSDSCRQLQGASPGGPVPQPRPAPVPQQAGPPQRFLPTAAAPRRLLQNSLLVAQAPVSVHAHALWAAQRHRSLPARG